MSNLSTAGQQGCLKIISKDPSSERVSVGEVSEACHGRHIRHELSEPSAVSSLYMRGWTAEKGRSVPVGANGTCS
jgi:hypothetical protein